jgi:hypothetical protein
MSSPPYQLVSDPTNKRELENFIKALFPIGEIMMEPESKRVGYREGLNLIELMGRMTKLEKQLESSNEEQHKQQEMFKEQQQKREKQQQMFKEQQELFRENERSLLMAHADELEWTVSLDDEETRYKRNEIIHGGNIKISIKAIAFLEKRGEISRAQNASIGFEATYGFSMHELKPVIATAPEEMVELLNMRGTLRKLDIWRMKFHTKSEKWIEACEEIIRAWLRAGGGSASYHRNQAKEEYMKISQWMADCVNDARKGKK